jgi:hypothetical protein
MARKKRKPTDIIQVNLRITEEMRRDLLARAKESGSSFNGELVELIRRGMGKPGLSEMIARGAVERIAVERQELREELRKELLYEQGLRMESQVRQAEVERLRASAAARIMKAINAALSPYVYANPNQQAEVPPQVLTQVHHHLGEAMALLEPSSVDPSYRQPIKDNK